jgi:hypothetical protein
VDYFAVNLAAGEKIQLSVAASPQETEILSSVTANARANAGTFLGDNHSDGPHPVSASTEARDHYLYNGLIINGNPEEENLASAAAQGNLTQAGTSGKLLVSASFVQELLGWHFGGATSGGSIDARLSVESNYSGTLETANTFGGSNAVGLDGGVGWSFSESGYSSEGLCIFLAPCINMQVAAH